jgi:hypothetical protein
VFFILRFVFGFVDSTDTPKNKVFAERGQKYVRYIARPLEAYGDGLAARDISDVPSPPGPVPRVAPMTFVGVTAQSPS